MEITASQGWEFLSGPKNVPDSGWTGKSLLRCLKIQRIQADQQNKPEYLIQIYPPAYTFRRKILWRPGYIGCPAFLRLKPFY